MSASSLTPVDTDSSRPVEAPEQLHQRKEQAVYRVPPCLFSPSPAPLLPMCFQRGRTWENGFSRHTDFSLHVQGLGYFVPPAFSHLLTKPGGKAPANAVCRAASATAGCFLQGPVLCLVSVPTQDSPPPSLAAWTGSRCSGGSQLPRLSTWLVLFAHCRTDGSASGLLPEQPLG